MKYLSLFSLCLFLAGCGYSIAASPYGLAEPLVLSVPIAVNHSSYGDLGPRLTREIIGRLDSSSNITIREDAPATLRLTLTRVMVSGGAWVRERNEYDLPTGSASRVVNLTVEAMLEKGDAPAQRRTFSGLRNFYVNEDESQTRLLEDEAFAWVLSELAQNIAQTFFAEF